LYPQAPPETPMCEIDKKLAPWLCADMEGGKVYFPKYILITPARNEEAFIELTIKSMIAQTKLPLKWVIVSDGSTDSTNEIVSKYSDDYNWIDFVVLPQRKERHFAGKVYAFNAGYERIKNLNYDIIGSLDADISFDPEYFEFLLGKLAQEPNLGVTGTPFREGGVQYDYRFMRKEHVSGACQLFKRQCFEAIGGYFPLKIGAIDLVAVITARMKGWKTETFLDKFCVHHRRMSEANQGLLKSSLRNGYYNYALGVHPCWHFFHSIYQMRYKPYILSGFLLMAGYVWAAVGRTPSLVSKEFVNFRRREQMRWLREYFVRVLHRLGKLYG
jgi:poly-beta-1,6-N-acetyl-D-glucosamine synthase